MKAALNATSMETGPAGRPASRTRLAADVRELRFEDYDELQRLHPRNGLPVRSPEEWRQTWIGNPAYEARREHWPIGWVLTGTDGAIVGAIGNLPVEYRLGGQPLLAAASSSWVVDPGFRGHSLRLLVEFMRQRVDFVLSTTVTPQSEAALRALGWRKAPVGRWDRSEFWITNRTGFAHAALRRHSGPVRRWMAYPILAVLSCLDALGAGGGRRGLGERFETGQAFDERWDGLWERLQEEKRDVLLAVRSRASLAWHFRRALARGELTVVSSPGRHGLDAYAVFDRQDQPSCGLKRLRLVDWQAVEGGEGNLPAMLGWMLHRCREERIDVLEVSGGWLPPLLGASLGPRFARWMPAWSYYYRTTPPQAGAHFSDPAVWAPSSYDGDTSI